MFDIDMLRSFKTVAECRRFGLAAQTMNKTTGAVSMQIKKLEEISGGLLFHRDRRGVTLTEAGQRLLRHAEPVLQAHDRLLAEMTDLTVSGHIRLGVPHEYSRLLLRSLLPACRNRASEITFEIESNVSQSLVQDFEKGRLDICLAALPKDQTQAEATELARLSPVWVGMAGIDQVRPLPLAVYPEGCPYRVVGTAALKQAGIPWRAGLVSANSDALLAAAEEGIAATIIDRRQLKEPLAVLESLPELPEFHMVLLARNTDKRKAAGFVASVICEFFRL